MKDIRFVLSKMSKLFLVAIAIFFVMSSSAYADNPNGDETSSDEIEQLKQSINEKQSQIDAMNEEKNTIQNNKTNIQNVINSLEASKNEVANYITELDEQLAVIQSNVEMYNQMVADKQEEIDETTIELNEALADEEMQYEAMKERIRFMYESGESMYLELLLSAESFGDMLNKADYIEQLSAYDRRMLEQYTLTVEYVSQVKSELEAEESVLEEAAAAAAEEEENMNTLIAEKESELDVYNADIDNKQEAIDAYNEEIRLQTADIEALEAVLNAEKAALAAATSISYDGGMFTWPAPSYTRISSPFGYRTHPILGTTLYHNGVDMASPMGTPILAAYYGEVAAVGYTSAMGNYIMIDHGSGLYTIYMHASRLDVEKGQVVTAGQQIGLVGSTGRSTGPHLHFGVRLNGEYVDPMSYL